MKKLILLIAMALSVTVIAHTDFDVIDEALTNIEESQEFKDSADDQNRRSDANTTPQPTPVPTPIPKPTPCIDCTQEILR